MTTCRSLAALELMAWTITQRGGSCHLETWGPREVLLSGNRVIASVEQEAAA